MVDERVTHEFFLIIFNSPQTGLVIGGLDRDLLEENSAPIET